MFLAAGSASERNRYAAKLVATNLFVISMDRTAWIENRVLWRLGKHGTVKDNVATGENIPPDYLAAVLSQDTTLTVGNPVMAFSGTDDKWTLLATELIASNHHGGIHAMDLHNGFRIASPFDKLEFKQIATTKSELQFLSLVAPNSQSVTIWAPKGSPCFALWNILLMFPFKHATN